MSIVEIESPLLGDSLLPHQSLRPPSQPWAVSSEAYPFPKHSHLHSRYNAVDRICAFTTGESARKADTG